MGKRGYLYPFPKKNKRKVNTSNPDRGAGAPKRCGRTNEGLQGRTLIGCGRTDEWEKMGKKPDLTWVRAHHILGGRAPLRRLRRREAQHEVGCANLVKVRVQPFLVRVHLHRNVISHLRQNVLKICWNRASLQVRARLFLRGRTTLCGRVFIWRGRTFLHSCSTCFFPFSTPSNPRKIKQKRNKTKEKWTKLIYTTNSIKTKK